MKNGQQQNLRLIEKLSECFHFSVQQPLIALSDVHAHMQMQSFTTVVCYII